MTHLILLKIYIASIMKLKVFWQIIKRFSVKEPVEF